MKSITNDIYRTSVYVMEQLGITSPNDNKVFAYLFNSIYEETHTLKDNVSCIFFWLENDDELKKFNEEFIKDQEPLEPEFQKVLYDNLWELITDK